MRSFIIITITIALLLYLSGISIKLNPLKITFNNGYFAIGVILIVIGIMFIQFQSNKDGFEKGVELTAKYLFEKNIEIK